MPLSGCISRRSFLAAATLAAARAQNKRTVFVVPNFHPASCGWLTNFSMERVYCANSYFDHLDRVRDDPNYCFPLSECNNMIAMMNFKPERTVELKSAIRAGRVELVNGFFLESTVNLSGGEALVRLGIEGLRWQQEVFGVRPRFAWCIDVCGTHPQMAQIAAGLGLEALVYTRGNITGSAIHRLDAPDGTRILAIAPGHYSDLGNIFAATGPMPEPVALWRWAARVGVRNCGGMTWNGTRPGFRISRGSTTARRSRCKAPGRGRSPSSGPAGM